MTLHSRGLPTPCDGRRSLGRGGTVSSSGSRLRPAGVGCQSRPRVPSDPREGVAERAVTEGRRPGGRGGERAGEHKGEYSLRAPVTSVPREPGSRASSGRRAQGEPDGGAPVSAALASGRRAEPAGGATTESI